MLSRACIPRLAAPETAPVRALLVGVLLLALAGPAHAQRSGQQREKLKGVGVTQKLGATIPMDLTFQNEAGEPVRLGDYFDGNTPVLLTLNYHRCPQLCQIQLRKFAETIDAMDWTPGEQFEIVTVDINPDEGPAMARTAQKRYRAAFDRPEAALDGWHFLTGDSPAIDALADSVGFRYRRLADRSQEFAHPAALTFLSGTGKITRYFTTLDPAPGDVRTAIVEASDGEVGTVADRVFLSCLQFDPESNSYSASAFKLMRYGSIFMALVLGAALYAFWRRERTRQDATETDGVDAALDEALGKRG
jgi:protein SCO1/2